MYQRHLYKRFISQNHKHVVNLELVALIVNDIAPFLEKS